MILFLTIVLAVVSLTLVVLVLLHRGKGGGLSSMLGGSFYSSLSGSSVVERNLDRITIIAGVLWAVCIVGLYGYSAFLLFSRASYARRARPRTASSRHWPETGAPPWPRRTWRW